MGGGVEARTVWLQPLFDVCLASPEEPAFRTLLCLPRWRVAIVVVLMATCHCALE